MVGKPLRQLWKLITSSETIEGSVEATKTVFELAKTLNEQKDNNPQIKQLVEKIPTLLEALNSPLGQIVNSGVPFLPIATGVIKYFVEANQQEPSITEIITITIQAAYLESIKTTLAGEGNISLDVSSSDVVQRKITQLGDLKVDDYEARLALVYFNESIFAQAFNEVLLVKLIESRLDESESNLLIEKVAINTSKYIYQVLPELGDSVKRLLEWYSSGGKDKFEKYASIDIYLEERITPLPKEKVFKEEFNFQDIYVPLKAKFLTFDGNKTDTPEFILEEWVQKAIVDDEKKDKVIFIQAGAGRGKSVFCRMFADWTRKKLHPRLTPILIRLRDIENYGQSFDQTLTDALSHVKFVKSDPAWLADPDTRYLFLLDGFDELRIEGRATGGISRFIRQVGAFQEKFTGKENGHRIIITGRPLALQGITDLPRNLERVKLLPMDKEIQEQWFNNWQQVIKPDNRSAAEVEKLKNLLQSNKCPKEIKDNLAKEPLLLYLIAKLHREGEIKQEDFEEAKSRIDSKILIYEKSLEFVLKEQRDEYLQQNITGLNPDNLERILIEAGLSVVQSGGEYAKVKMIEDRLDKDNSEAANTLRELREQNGEKAITTALGAFYLRPAAGRTGGGVEFYHKSFSEFLCAKRLQESIEEWTETSRRRRKWTVDDKELAEQIYDLFGYGGLTPEIVEYLMGLLQQSEEFQPAELFERLEDFYFRWCDGEFIDAKKTILPHLKMLELEEQLPERETYLGQRQVDIYAGLNIMILLLELHRYGQSQENLSEDIKQKLTFYPSGKPKAEDQLEDPKLLLRLINYSNCIGFEGFNNTVGSFLSSANLSSTNLSSANLTGANLSSANLKGAMLSHANLSSVDLYNANLYSANLYSANLEGVDLYGANLSSVNLYSANLKDAMLSHANLSSINLYSANLEGVDLSNANLEGVDLEGANLKGANLKGANLKGANLKDIRWNEETNWSGVKGLYTAINVPEALKQAIT